MIKIVTYRKVDADDVHGQTEEWSVEIEVDEVFHINFPVPIEIKPDKFQEYLDALADRVLLACKQIYAPVLSRPVAQVERYIDLRNVKASLEKSRS